MLHDHRVSYTAGKDMLFSLLKKTKTRPMLHLRKYLKFIMCLLLLFTDTFNHYSIKYTCFLSNLASSNILYSMEGTKRSNIKIGQLVNIVLKSDQRTGNLTEGIVKDILTKSPNHPHGIKVRLESGDVGRVKEILQDEE